MSVIALGISHKTAPLAVREQAAFAPQTAASALKDLLKQEAVNEAVILSTCNRTEVYCDHENPQALNAWLAKQRAFDPDVLARYHYVYQDIDAVKHLLKVASSLDSMVLGEPQIFGQVKSAFAYAQQCQAVGAQLGRLFPFAFEIGKEVRSKTGIGKATVSVALTAVRLAQDVHPNLQHCHVLLIGAGDTILTIATHLQQSGVKNIVIAHRSQHKSPELEQRFNAQCIAIGDIPAHLNKVDLIFSATASPLPIVGKGAIERAMHKRQGKPLSIVDLAVPRDVEPEVAEIDHVHLHNIDDLQDVIEENKKSRQLAAREAEAIIDLRAQHFMQELQALATVDLIRRYRSKIESIRDAELGKALSRLSQGDECPGKLMTEFARTLTNKIMHDPSTQMHQAAVENETELLVWARQLLKL